MSKADVNVQQSGWKHFDAINPAVVARTADESRNEEEVGKETSHFSSRKKILEMPMSQ